MLNSIKTEDQRMTVEIGMDCIMPGIEIANDILYDAWEEFFGNVPQPSIVKVYAFINGDYSFVLFHPFKIQILCNLAEPNGDFAIATERADIHNCSKHCFLRQFL